jgi:hypothetical protein
MTFARAARTREIFRRCRGGVNGREFMIKYKLYGVGEPACCPTFGTDDVGFSWTGGQLNALSPIPVPAERFGSAAHGSLG